MNWHEWMYYLGISFVAWVVASLLNEWVLRKDPSERTSFSTLIFIVSIVFYFIGFIVTLIATFGIGHLTLSRLEGHDESSYKSGYIAGYNDAKAGKKYDSEMPTK